MKNNFIQTQGGRLFGRTAKTKERVKALIEKGYSVAAVTKSGVNIMIKES